jgi:hypothetical protein
MNSTLHVHKHNLHFELVLELLDLLARELGELCVDGGLDESGLDNGGSVHAVRRLVQLIPPAKPKQAQT